jgi:nicotinate-nucleotide--dimethylbenzimidazole phosphoribosyltransferase
MSSIDIGGDGGNISRNDASGVGRTSEGGTTTTTTVGEEKHRSRRVELDAILIDPTCDYATRYDAVRAYLDALAKPIGSLGHLEEYACRLCSLKRSSSPNIDNVACLIYAADHGIAGNANDEGGMDCSSYPRSVTRKVLEGLNAGIGGASVLARANGATLRVIDVGLAASPNAATSTAWSRDSVVRHPSDGSPGVCGGTSNFCVRDAMTELDVENCMRIGRDETSNFVREIDADVVVFGEVGIGNTTTCSALISALCGVSDPSSVCGTGSAPPPSSSSSSDGDADIISKKSSIIDMAMRRVRENLQIPLANDPILALRAVGGAEIASIVGGMLECSMRDMPILVDGYIVTTCAMISCMIDPSVCRLLMFATRSTEVGQLMALDVIRDIARSHDLPLPPMPALDMGLRMGEATGALLALPLIRSACSIVAELATLDEVLGL